MTPKLATALHAFQKEAPPIHFDATNPHFKNRYASLAGVVAAIRPVLNKHGLIFSQLPTNLDGLPAVETMVMHAASGEQLSATAPLILAKSDPQGYGSALTYARRYALLSILGLVGDEDDDANTASNGAAQARQGGSQSVGDGAGGDTQGLQQARGDAGGPAATGPQKNMIRRLEEKLKVTPRTDVDAVTKTRASGLIETLLAAEAGLTAEPASAPGGASLDADIPFMLSEA